MQVDRVLHDKSSNEQAIFRWKIAKYKVFMVLVQHEAKMWKADHKQIPENESQ